MKEKEAHRIGKPLFISMFTTHPLTDFIVDNDDGYDG